MDPWDRLHGAKIHLINSKVCPLSDCYLNVICSIIPVWWFHLQKNPDNRKTQRNYFRGHTESNDLCSNARAVAVQNKQPAPVCLAQNTFWTIPARFHGQSIEVYSTWTQAQYPTIIWKMWIGRYSICQGTANLGRIHLRSSIYLLIYVHGYTPKDACTVGGLN